MNGIEMPMYQSHKKVWALKIEKIEFVCPIKNATISDAINGATITPKDDRYKPFEVSYEYCKKHKPTADGYYVMYKDGYCSWSPADAFESGYSLIADKIPEIPEILEGGHISFQAENRRISLDPALRMRDGLMDSICDEMLKDAEKIFLYLDR